MLFPEEQGSNVVTMRLNSVCYVQELIATPHLMGDIYMDNGISNHATCTQYVVAHFITHL